MRSTWSTFVAWVNRSVTLPDDSESIRIRKTTLAIIFIVIVPVNFVWTLSLFYLGLMLPALINLAHGLLTAAAIVYLFRTRNFANFGHALMAVTLVYVYSLQSSLGGIIHSGGLIVGGMLAVMGAALVASRRSAIFWAGVNVVGMTFALAFEEQFAGNTPAALPADYGLVNGFFNAVWTTFLAMFLILYLVRELETAQDLADSLLFNVLPRPIADQLKRGGGTIADSYESASVLFADIVGFTPLSNVLSPEEMIALLNEIYSHFDTLVEKHGVEKLRTIGDNYMVAAGVPEPRPDHAQALADLALDMQSYCRRLAPVGGRSLQFRIGINSGPLIAGVIGTTRFQYDIWGDTVNTASRMESHGEPGVIQVTEETRALLGEAYELVPRGEIEVKGKGELRTWFLERRKEVQEGH
ncbi:MAG TPA: adenylate/guanylate cyclase domain-containing protein [Anaerolineales bacterium]|nr:adenylate/guanylate cyclase domain-containing protein [Anaerolineales bacterium]